MSNPIPYDEIGTDRKYPNPADGVREAQGAYNNPLDSLPADQLMNINPRAPVVKPFKLTTTGTGSR